MFLFGLLCGLLLFLAWKLLGIARRSTNHTVIFYSGISSFLLTVGALLIIMLYAVDLL
jgi:hypothetical protein